MRNLNAAALGIFLIAANGLPAYAWDDIPNLACREVISADGAPTQKSQAMLIWMLGYKDGIAALAVLDKRLQKVGETDFDQLGAVVLTLCKVKQEQSVGAAVTGAFELLINAQPGRRLDLALPKR